MATVTGCAKNTEPEAVAIRRADVFHCAVANGRCYPRAFFALFERLGAPHRKTLARRTAWCTQRIWPDLSCGLPQSAPDAAPASTANRRCYSSAADCNATLTSNVPFSYDGPCEALSPSDVQLLEFVDLWVMQRLAEAAGKGREAHR